MRQRRGRGWLRRGRRREARTPLSQAPSPPVQGRRSILVFLCLVQFQVFLEVDCPAVSAVRADVVLGHEPAPQLAPPLEGLQTPRAELGGRRKGALPRQPRKVLIRVGVRPQYSRRRASAP